MTAMNRHDILNWLVRNGQNRDNWAEFVPIELVMTDQSGDVPKIYAKVTFKVTDGYGVQITDMESRFILRTEWIPFDFIEADRASREGQMIPDHPPEG